MIPSHFPISCVLFSRGVFSCDTDHQFSGDLAELGIDPCRRHNRLPSAVGDAVPVSTIFFLSPTGTSCGKTLNPSPQERILP